MSAPINTDHRPGLFECIAIGAAGAGDIAIGAMTIATIATIALTILGFESTTIGIVTAVPLAISMLAVLGGVMMTCYLIYVIYTDKDI